MEFSTIFLVVESLIKSLDLSQKWICDLCAFKYIDQLKKISCQHELWFYGHVILVRASLQVKNLNDKMEANLND